MQQWGTLQKVYLIITIHKHEYIYYLTNKKKRDLLNF